MRGQGHVVSAVPTTGPRTAGGIARRLVEAGADLILAAGGDGTTNEVLEGVAGSQVPLGILPVGTANVLANEMRLERRLPDAAAAIGEMQARRIATGRLCSGETRPFLCMAGIGLDAHIVYRLSVPLKNRIGKAAYWAAGARVLGQRLAEFEVEVDGRCFTSTFALVSRVRNYGGDFRIAPRATLLDDSFEVVLFRPRNTLGYVRYLAGMALDRLARMRGVTILRARRLRLRAYSDPRIYVQVDGEYAGRLPASIEFVPDSLSLLMPAGYPARGPRRADS